MIAPVKGGAPETKRHAAWRKGSVLRTSREGRPYINLNG
jgi:hypothetical protein